MSRKRVTAQWLSMRYENDERHGFVREEAYVQGVSGRSRVAFAIRFDDEARRHMAAYDGAKYSSWGIEI
ncbi:MAG: hypothetical protein ACXVIX_10000 [Halobacteriota archaeon]